MRYSFKLTSFVQYFVVLGKSIFLHFRSISNKLKKVVSIRVEIRRIEKNSSSCGCQYLLTPVNRIVCRLCV
ncbi:hypothetical protein T09_2207 [Trichinella sp. T9]|nr:hypothetical protein T09_2207 [Trichinella sp. T9]